MENVRWKGIKFLQAQILSVLLLRNMQEHMLPWVRPKVNIVKYPVSGSNQ